MSTYGDKIKQLRKENNLTQAELGEKLFVTSQAVSKWEKGLSEPDLDAMKKMCELFGVSMDEFMEIDRKKQEDEPSVKEEIAVTTVLPVAPEDDSPKKVIEGYCENCKKALYAGEYEVFSESKRHGKTTRHVQHVYCKECAEQLLKEEAERKKLQKEKEKREEKKRTKKGFVVGGVIGGLVLLVLAIALAVLNQIKWIWVAPVAGYCVLSFIVQMFMEESIIVDIVGFFMRSFKMPGVIFTLDIDGIVFLICVKLFLGVLSWLLSACLFSVGLAIGFVLSAFAFPFEVTKYVRKYKNV